MKRWWIVGLSLLAAPALASAHSEGDSCDHSAHDEQAVSTQRVKVDVGPAPSRGPAQAKVTVVVFSDFECPFCRRATGTLKALDQKFGDRIRVVFKNRPMPRHTHARLAAAAALAANDQGHFWEFHDWLFSGQAKLDEDSLVKKAEQLGMNGTQFRQDLDSGRFNGQIDADVAQADSLGVEGTPTFFINGMRVVGAQPAETLEQLVNAELTRSP